ncbi:MAG: hypothetical protein WCO44_09585 [Bacteroidota bacterium]
MQLSTSNISVSILVVFSTLALSCSSYKLSESDLGWQPYRKSDLLIFKSNNLETDSIMVRSVETLTNSDDHLAVFPNSIQSLFVNGKQNILELQAGKKGSFIHFTLKLGNRYLKYPNVVESVKEIDQKKFDNNEIIVIKAKEYYDNLKGQPFNLRCIHWSKVFGYVKLEFNNEYSWELQSFIRDGKNLMKK